MVNAASDEALRRLKETDPPSWLVPNPALSETARAASQYLFSSLRPFCQKSPLDKLLVDGFDAEQIWQQIDLQSQPILSTLRRRLKQLVKNPEEITQLKVPSEVAANKLEEKKIDEWEQESDDFDEELDEADEDEDEEGVEKEGEKGVSEEEEKEDDDGGKEKSGDEEEEGVESEDEEEEGGESEDDKVEDGGIEDKFLKIDELNEYLEKEEDNFDNDDVDRKGAEGDDQETEDDEVRLLSA